MDRESCTIRSVGRYAMQNPPILYDHNVNSIHVFYFYFYYFRLKNTNYEAYLSSTAFALPVVSTDSTVCLFQKKRKEKITFSTIAIYCFSRKRSKEMFYAFLYYVSSEIVIKDYSTHGPSFFMPLKEFFIFYFFERKS